MTTSKQKSQLKDRPQVEANESSPVEVAHFTRAERESRGREARAETPRSSHASFDTFPARDSVELLEQQAASRVPELVPIRYGRMLVSPFTFYRGAAAIMAHDLAPTPRAGLQVQLCGDAHLSNFGGFASPERILVFDVNDFDETLPGPFEWDVKRLAASVEIAGRDRSFSDKERRKAVLASVRSYREAMSEFAAMDNLAVWYAQLDASAIQALAARAGKKQAKTFDKTATKARTKDSIKAFSKLTTVVDGQPRIVADPPLIVPIADLAGGQDIEEEIHRLLRLYRQTLQPDRRHLIESFSWADLARKVVGVGSVGTRAWIMLLFGADETDPLFLQIKEADESVLEPYVGKSSFGNHGQRVVEGQRMMQATSDIFLGFIRSTNTLDGRPRDFYVRQLWDWKSSADLEIIEPRGLELYAQVCGWTLARAHARSGDRVAIAAYLGQNDVFDRALSEFATAYADLNDRDYQALTEAAASGRIKVQGGL
jgi:uncharacterized protein (DUF2252 family)